MDGKDKYKLGENNKTSKYLHYNKNGALGSFVEYSSDRTQHEVTCKQEQAANALRLIRMLRNMATVSQLPAVHFPHASPFLAPLPVLS
jgi:hypothetical protein